MSALSEALATARASRGETIDTVVARAQAAGHPIDRGTVSRYERDKAARRLPESMVRALAAGFLIPEREVRVLAGMPPGDREPWVPPEKAARLSRDQRAVLDRLIEVMVTPVPNGSDTAAAQSNSESGHTPDRAPSVGAATPKREQAGPSGASGEGIDAGDLDIPAYRLRGEHSGRPDGREQGQHEDPPPVRPVRRPGGAAS